MNKFFIVANANGKTPEILVYGLIGSDDANSTDFVKALKALETKHTKINVRINSDGGSVMQGLAMYAAMVNSPAEINTYIDGFAGSMAAVLAMAGKKVFMSKYARLMTHCASGAIGGNADEMRNTAKLLDSLDNTMCVIYANRTGKTPEQCLADYVSRKEDKWFTPAEAMTEKLIDGIYDGDPLTVPANATAATLWSFYNEHKFAAILNSQNQNENMNTKLSAASIAALNITAVAPEAITDTVIDTAIAALKVKADQAESFKTAKEAAEKKYNDHVKAENTVKINAAVDAAVTGGKVSKAAGDLLKADYAENYAGLEALLKDMPAQKTITSQLKKEGAGDETDVTLAAEWDKLDKSKGGTAKLKAENIDRYKQLYQAKFGTEYTGK